MKTLASCALGALLLLTSAAQATTSEAIGLRPVDIPLAGRGDTIKGYLLRAGRPNRPVVLFVHGCGGLWRPPQPDHLYDKFLQYAQLAKRNGYNALFVDSFKSRSVVSACSVAERKAHRLFVRDRAVDVLAAARWVRTQPDMQNSPLGAVSFSQGSSTMLTALDAGKNPGVFRGVVAYYPGCVTANKNPQYKANAPLLVLMGKDDNWTDPRPCQSLCKRLSDAGEDVRMVLYDGAVHGFDAPSDVIRPHAKILSSVDGKPVLSGGNPQARKAALQETEKALQRFFR